LLDVLRYEANDVAKLMLNLEAIRLEIIKI